MKEVYTSIAYFDPITIIEFLKEKNVSSLRSTYLVASRNTTESMPYLNCCEIGDACMYHSHGSTFMSPGILLPRLVEGAWV